MLINAANLKALNDGFKKVFTDQLKGTENTCEKIATVVTVNSLSVNYAWLGDFPQMKEWLGDRVLKDLAAYNYQITRKKFEATIEVNSEDIEFDNIGIVKPRIQMMASEAKTHYDFLTYGVLETNGFCYNGKKFFATDHPMVTAPASTFSNLGVKALTQDSFLEARGNMRKIKGDTGTPLRIVPNLLIVPPALEQTAVDILKKDFLAGGESNTTKGYAEILVADYLTDDKAWYLMDATKPLKPLILQKTKEIRFMAMDKPDDENVFMRDKFRYGVDTSCNSGYGLPQLAFKSTGTA